MCCFSLWRAGGAYGLFGWRGVVWLVYLVVGGRGCCGGFGVGVEWFSWEGGNSFEGVRQMSAAWGNARLCSSGCFRSRRWKG